MNKKQMFRRLTSAKGSGFTLIELLIVVVVIAILATIAFPSYRYYIIKSNRAAAKACLSQLSNYMERYYATNLRYDRDTSPAQAPIVLPSLDCVVQTTSYNFGFSPGGSTFRGITTAPSAPSPNPSQIAYELQAAPQGNQTDDTQCGTLALDQTGTQGISSTTGDVQRCWDK